MIAVEQTRAASAIQDANAMLSHLAYTTNAMHHGLHYGGYGLGYGHGYGGFGFRGSGLYGHF